MITVFQFLHDYCERKNLPTPTPEDIAKVGKVINYHFRNYWTKNLPEGIIPETGFVISIEGDNKFTVIGYPETFIDDMEKRTNYYYEKIKCNVVVEEKKVHPAKKDRIRKPINLAYSSKSKK